MREYERKKKKGGEGTMVFECAGNMGHQERSLDQSLLCELDASRYFFRQLFIYFFSVLETKINLGNAFCGWTRLVRFCGRTNDMNSPLVSRFTVVHLVHRHLLLCFAQSKPVSWLEIRSAYYEWKILLITRMGGPERLVFNVCTEKTSQTNWISGSIRITNTLRVHLDLDLRLYCIM